MKNLVLLLMTFNLAALCVDSDEESQQMCKGPLWDEEEPWEANETDVMSTNDSSDSEDGSYFLPWDAFSLSIKYRQEEFIFCEDTFSPIFKSIFEWDHDALNEIIKNSPESLLEKEESNNFSLLMYSIYIINKEAVEILLQHDIVVTADDLSFAFDYNRDICELLINSANNKDKKILFFNGKNGQGFSLAHQIVTHSFDEVMRKFLRLSLVEDITVINPLIETPSKCNLFMYMHERSCFSRFDDLFDFFTTHYGKQLPSELFFSDYHGSILQAALNCIGSCTDDGYPFCPAKAAIECVIKHNPTLVNHTCKKYPFTPLDILYHKYVFSKDAETFIKNRISDLMELLKKHGGLSTEEFLSLPIQRPQPTKSARMFVKNSKRD